MSKICPKCGSIRIVDAPSVDVSICLACEAFLNTVNGKSKQTVFDSITASPEVLAEVLVYESPGYNKDGDKDVFYRSKVDKFWVYTTREEAIAATLEELNKVSK